VPHRRSTPLADGFGMNIDLPREPRMPWTRPWTPIFGAGVKWMRIGQQTSWDWIWRMRFARACRSGVPRALHPALRHDGALGHLGFPRRVCGRLTDQHSDTIESVEEITRRTQPALAHSPGKKCGLWSPVRTILRKPQSGQVSA